MTAERLGRAFFRAEWRYLVMLNYEIDPAILRPLVPAGTSLDLWQGRALVSVVGFRFLGTKVLGAAPELNADVADLYGVRLTPALSGAPASMFIAEGSAVVVSAPRHLPRAMASARRRP